jgi:hypothetical protein
MMLRILALTLVMAGPAWADDIAFPEFNADAGCDTLYSNTPDYAVACKLADHSAYRMLISVWPALRENRKEWCVAARRGVVAHYYRELADCLKFEIAAALNKKALDSGY